MPLKNKKLLTTSLLLTLFLVSLAVVNTSASGQSQQSSAPALDWQNTYAGESTSWIAQTSDGGFVFFVQGVQSSWAYWDNSLATLTKIDSAGNVLWIENFSYPFPMNILTTSDGGYAYTTLDNNVLTIGKLYSNGNSQWNQTCGRPVSGPMLLVQTNDDGFAVAVHNDTGYNGQIDVQELMLFKADAQGRSQWTKTFNSLNCNYTFRSLIQTSDGGYALAGSSGATLGVYSTGSLISSGSDFCLVKISSEGNLQWTKIYGGYLDDDANSLVQTNDDGYAMVGNTRSFGAGGTDALIVKTDALGNPEWAQTYGGCGQTAYLYGQKGLFGQLNNSLITFHAGSTGAFNDYANYIVQTSDGGLAFAGSTEYDPAGGTNAFAWLVKTDANGFAQWNETYADTEVDPLGQWHNVRWDVNALIQAKDGSFVMAGYSGDSLHNWDQACFIIKTKPAVALATTSFPPSSLPSGFHNNTIAIVTATPLGPTNSASSLEFPLIIVTSLITVAIVTILIATTLIRRKRQKSKSVKSISS
jgi:hypothetical protein